MLHVSKVKAITLDLDDTLWPVEPTIARAEQALADWLTQHAPATARLLGDAPVRSQLRKAVLQAHPEVAHDFSALRLAYLRRAMAQAGDDTALAQPAFEVFFDERQKVTLFPDSLAALAALAARYPVVAVSNGNASVHRVGLGAYFVGSVSAQSCGVAKPHIDIFHTAARSVQCAPNEVLHVGDDAHLDVVGALDAGMQAAWINRDAKAWSHPQTPHITAADMAALCTALGLSL
ncbi:MAG: HAD-IA family hydrolase [Rhodoferax sp.]